MDTLILLKNIEQVFPFVEMPPKDDLVFKKNDNVEFEDLREDIEQHRGGEISSEFIRLIHQELSLLSAASWQWLLPYYLRYCLTVDAEYSRMEVEFLIYSLGPVDEFKDDTVERLSRLNQHQVDCIVSFLQWCFDRQFWREYCGDDIERAMRFLLSIGTNATKLP
jgi:hypothetical protein